MMQAQVGIDVSKSTFNAAFRSGDGRWLDGKFDNSAAGFRAFLSWSGRECEFTMEATGLFHVKLALFLHGEGFRVNVSNPLRIKRFCQMQFRRTKTDSADARMIAQFAEFHLGKLKPWRPTDPALAEALALQTAMRLLVGQCTAKSHCIKALRLTDAGRKAALALARSLRAERRQIRDLDSAIETLVKAAYKQEYECARSIPGIGPKTAAAVILATGGLANFESSRQLSAYFGMSPRQYQSGTSINGKVHICKMGDSHVRSLLYMCSVSSLRLNKPCRAFYDSLLARGKPKKVAMMAVANKLLRVLFAVMKTKTTWSLEVAANV